MIKRPLVFMLLAYMAGGMLVKLKEWQALALIGILLVILILILFIFKISNRYINSLDQFLIVTPLFVYLGFILMSKQLAPLPMDSVFDRKSECRIEGTVYQIVNKGETTAVYTKDNRIKLLKESVQGENKGYKSQKVMLYIKECNELKVGNKIFVQGTLRKFSAASNLGQFNELQYYKTMGVDYKVSVEEYSVTDSSVNLLEQTLFELRNNMTQIYQKLLNEKEAGIISAMILGEKSLLEEDTKALYQQNGISHILAISGLHISFIGLMLFGVLRLIRVNHLTASCLTTVFLYCYGLMTNFSVSTNRAIVMMVVSMFAAVIGRTYDIITAMSLSALIILVQSPMQLFNAGFLLSYGAILGIGLVGESFNEIVQQMMKPMIEARWYFKSLSAVIQSFVISFSVNLVTLPVILYFFYEIPIYSVVLNLLIIPLSSLLILLPILAAIAGSFSIVLGRFIIGGAHTVLMIYETLCEIFQDFPGSIQIIGKPLMIQMVVYYAALFAVVGLIKKYKEEKRIFLILLLLLTIFIRPIQSELEITFLDVGQGDGIFIKTPENTTYFLDGGSSDVSLVGKYRMISFLKAQGVKRLNYAMITHTDKDHISGIIELMEASAEKNGILIDNLILPRISSVDNTYESLVQLAEKKGITILYIEKGDVIQDGAVRFTCLHPYYDFAVTSKNAYSTVLSMEYGQFKALFTGDLEKEGEEAVLHSEELLDYDLLKVAHHGSKYSTDAEFLSKTRPEIAIISAGNENRYGHPHKEVLERLKDRGIKIYTTMQSGAVTVRTDGKKIRINEYLQSFY